MDFLLLTPNHGRIVLEVDGASHYTDEDNRPSPSRYARNARLGRELQLRGYAVYRFGALELRDISQATRCSPTSSPSCSPSTASAADVDLADRPEHATTPSMKPACRVRRVGSHWVGARVSGAANCGGPAARLCRVLPGRVEGVATAAPMTPAGQPLVLSGPANRPLQHV
jgi:hypothetical protein